MTDTDETERQTMAEISHVDPNTGTAAGQLFRRGPTVVADGGEEPTDGDEESPTTQMKDVSHTPPMGATGTAHGFERGTSHDEAGGQRVGRDT